MNPWSTDDRRGQGSNRNRLLPVLTVLILLGALTVLARFHPSLATGTPFPGDTPSAADTPTAGDGDLLVLSGTTMGTGYRVLVPQKRLSAVKRASLQVAIADRLQTLDRGIFSTYAVESELSRLNRAAAGQTMTVSADLMAVLEAAGVVHLASRGAFDVTIKPLVDLWGFGAVPSNWSPPDEGAVAAARRRMGMDKVSLDPANGTVTLTGPVSLDLSAIAKGYAVDIIAALLTRQQVTDYLVEIGGEVRLSGRRPDGSPWQVGIEAPVEGTSRLYQAIAAGHGPMAIAASGNYRNFFMHDGTRYSHTIDPVSGWPVSHELASVTVIADSAMLADAWATALLVLGPEAGMKRANELQLAAYFIVDGSNGFSARYSSTFKPYL